MANTVDQDETAQHEHIHYEPSHPDLQTLNLYYVVFGAEGVKDILFSF